MNDGAVLGFLLVLVLFLLFMWLYAQAQANALDFQLKICELERNLYRDLYYMEKNLNSKILNVWR